MTHPCEGCIDWVPVSVTYGGSDRVCDYIGHTGHARIKICPPRELCTVKSTVPRSECVERYDRGGYPVRRKRAVGPPEKIPEDKVRELASKGFSDYRIGKELGFSQPAIKRFRVRHNIPHGSEASGVSK